MASPKKSKAALRKQGSRRTQNVELTAEERQGFINIWREHHGGTKRFAEEMANYEHPAGIASPDAVKAKTRCLYRIEDGDTGVSPEVFKTVSDVLGITTTELKKQLSTGVIVRRHSANALPWMTDEEALSKHRRVLYHYHQVKRGDEAYWICLPFDFTAQHHGYLYSSISVESEPKTAFTAYGYISGKILTLILRSRTDEEETESVHLFRDFVRLVREPSGCCGVAIHAAKSFGVSGTMILKRQFPYAEASGRQPHTQSRLLDQYWSSFQIKPVGLSPSRVLKIVSGGQTGADRSAWEFAKENGIPHRGWVPLGRRAEDGRIPAEWEADETETIDYAERTKRNVIDSNGTVVFSISPMLSGGSKQTVEFAKRHKRKHLHISKHTEDPARELAVFIKRYKIRTLNVAGPRASEEKDVGKFVKAVLMVATRLLATDPSVQSRNI